MPDREYLEAKANWQATFHRTPRNGGTVREPFDCLMRTVTGGYYWEAPDYQGMFAWGGTRDFTPSWTTDLLVEGSLELVAGELPDCLKEEIEKARGKGLVQRYARPTWQATGRRRACGVTDPCYPRAETHKPLSTSLGRLP